MAKSLLFVNAVVKSQNMFHLVMMDNLVFGFARVGHMLPFQKILFIRMAQLVQDMIAHLVKKD
ncbi:hypothetical protein A7A69_07225 [Acinetobacter sp. Ac_1271]|nr:hypothetical protein [Acinetobacter guerrae]